MYRTDAAAALIYNKRASAYMAQGNNNAALLDYDKAVELDPAALGSRLQRCASANLHELRVPAVRITMHLYSARSERYRTAGKRFGNRRALFGVDQLVWLMWVL